MPGPFRLEGKRALVTGASRGIGRAIALALADAGADVAVTSRNGDDGEPIAGEIRAKGRRSLALLLDVRHARSIRACFERLDQELGGLDILVNDAGTNIPRVTQAAAQKQPAKAKPSHMAWRGRSRSSSRRTASPSTPSGRASSRSTSPASACAASRATARRRSPTPRSDASFVTGQTLLVDGGTSAH